MKKYDLKPGNYLIGIDDDGTMKIKPTDGEGFRFVAYKTRLQLHSSTLCKYLFETFKWDVSTKNCLVTGVDEEGFLIAITR